MRLWPFRRSTRDGADGRRYVEQASEPTTGARPDPATNEPARPVEHWRRLAPLTRTSGAPPLVAPLRRITAGLAARADTGMVLAPLGHDRRQDAPIGTITGAIVPVARPVNAGVTTPTAPRLDLSHRSVHSPARPDGAAATGASDTTRPAAAMPIQRLRFDPPSPDSDPPQSALVPQPRPDHDSGGAPAASVPTTDALPSLDTLRQPQQSLPSKAVPTAVVTTARRLVAQPRSITATPPARVAESDNEPRRSPLPLGARPDTAGERPLSAPDVAPTTVARALSVPAPAATSDQTMPTTAPRPAEPTSAPTVGDIGRLMTPAGPAPTATAGSDTVADPGAVADPAPLPIAGRRTIHRRRVGEPLTHRPITMVAAPAATSELPTHIDSGASQWRLEPDAVPDRAPTRRQPPAARHGALPGPLARRADPVPSRARRPAAATAPRTDDRHPSERPRPAALIGGRAPLALQQPRRDERPAGPAGAPLPVSVVQRENDQPTVVPISRSPSRHIDADLRAPESVPADLRAQLEPMLGVDLSDVAVHRGPESSLAAADMHARAFTLGGEVHLPDKLGPTSHGEARATLAHELTHVAQQRRLGTVAPNENSPAGAAMEAEARDVARRIAGGQRVSVTTPVRQRPTVPMVHTLPSVASRAAGSSLSVAEASAVAAQVADAAVRSSLADRMTDNRGVTFGGITPTAASTIGAQREPEGSNQATTAQSRPAAAPLAQPASLESISQERLDELTGRLYEGIRTRLRHDLLVQRERAGALFDQR